MAKRGPKPGQKAGGRAKGTKNKRSEGVEAWARAAVEDPAYRASFLLRMNSGVLAPAVESMIWHYAYGKPTEKLELTGANQGPIVMRYGRSNKESLV